MAISTRHLWLLGLSGSGKSTVGPRLAQALQLPCWDLDREISADAKKTIPEIFQAEAEEGFRQRESRILAKISAGPGAVISCGGGAVLRPANRARMAETGLRIYLRADPDTLAQRLQTNQDRPLLAGDRSGVLLRQQLAERAPWYEESEIQIDVTALTPEETVSAIRDQLPAPWSR